MKKRGKKYKNYYSDGGFAKHLANKRVRRTRGISNNGNYKKVYKLGF